MQNQNYFSFVKWYFNLTTKNHFPKKPARRSVSQKERLPMVIFAYLSFVSSPVIFFLPFKDSFLLSATIIFISLICLSLCKFSFLYYAILYKKSKTINRSLNDKIIIQECMLYKLSQDVRYMLMKYYKIWNTKGNIFYVKYYLISRKKEEKNKNFILKIKPKKITINKTVISNKSLANLDEFKELIKNYFEN